MTSSSPLVRCPSCGDQKPYSLDNPYRPFCSKGCRAIDLGAWAMEQYRVAPAPDPALDAQEVWAPGTERPPQP